MFTFVCGAVAALALSVGGRSLIRILRRRAMRRRLRESLPASFPAHW